jgi:hypothetical protein
VNGGKNKTTVCETGIYNLTQDEAPALIHLGKDKTQQWLLPGSNSRNNNSRIRKRGGLSS